MRSEFPTTRWSVVLAARERDPVRAREALAALCEAYWYPLYAYVRRRGHDADQARDLTQGYFVRLLEKSYLDDVRPRAGRFRAFLVASLKHFISNEQDRDRALKRGGGRRPVSLDAEEAEDRYELDRRSDLSPERMFEMRWALTVLDRALDRLRREAEEAGNGEQFERLKCHLTGQLPRARYKQVAADLASSEGAVKMAVHRLRRRYGQLLRAEIADTVDDPAEVDDELRHLISVLGGR